MTDNQVQQHMTLNELKARATELGLTADDVRYYGKLSAKQSWVDAIAAVLVKEPEEAPLVVQEPDNAQSDMETEQDIEYYQDRVCVLDCNEVRKRDRTLPDYVEVGIKSYLLNANRELVEEIFPTNWYAEFTSKEQPSVAYTPESKAPTTLRWSDRHYVWFDVDGNNKTDNAIAAYESYKTGNAQAAPVQPVIYSNPAFPLLLLLVCLLLMCTQINNALVQPTVAYTKKRCTAAWKELQGMQSPFKLVSIV